MAYVGVCWVSARLLTSPRGHVLIDSLYGSYTDRLLDNVRRLGYDPKDIKLVVMTHGHRDHAGGAARLKQMLDPVPASRCRPKVGAKPRQRPRRAPAPRTPGR